VDPRSSIPMLVLAINRTAEELLSGRLIGEHEEEVGQTWLRTGTGAKLVIQGLAVEVLLALERAIVEVLVGRTYHAANWLGLAYENLIEATLDAADLTSKPKVFSYALH